MIAEGRSAGPETVKYHLLPPLLLNELQRQERELHFHRWMLLILVISTIGLIWAGPRLYRQV